MVGDSSKWWMVRAGQNAAHVVEFLDRGVVTIGGEKEGDLSAFSSQQEVLKLVSHAHPEWKAGRQRMWASQIYRFAHEINVGDWIVTYNPEHRIYHVGQAIGPYEHTLGYVADHPNYRAVQWIERVERDRLSLKARNSLGAISSLFRIPDEVGQEFSALLNGSPACRLGDAVDLEEDELSTVEDMAERAQELAKDRVSQLDWDQMQNVVAGVLRAMGYKTRISPSGPDRGKDIVASPDGFGFENPRIVVEVKHRQGSPMGAQAIRSFLGGRHPQDKGLYVSTGGFTKDAYYEAERANIPMTLWSLEELVRAIIDYYEQLDIEIKQLLPMKKIFWPMDL